MFERPFPEGAFVAFIVPVDRATRVNQTDVYSSDTASLRLRALIPARQLAKRVPVWLVPLEDFVRDPELSKFGRAGAIVISKLPVPNILRRPGLLPELIESVSSYHGTASLYADLADDLAALGRATGEAYLASYQKGLGAACTLIVPSRALGEGVACDARHGVAVIEDPYENREQPVRVVAATPLRLLWFGNLGGVNCKMLMEALASTVSHFPDTPLRLEIVTHKAASEYVGEIRGCLRSVHPKCELCFTQWSLQVTDEALARCDFVLLPHAYHADWSRGKSHNRLVAAIRAGRFAIASPISTYQELSDYAWVGEDLAAGLQWGIEHQAEAAERVQWGQLYVGERFSPETIGRRWAETLGIHRTERP